MACLGLNFQGVARLLKINANMRFYKKNMGIMPNYFFYLNSRVGGGKGSDKVLSVPSEHGSVLT